MRCKVVTWSLEQVFDVAADVGVVFDPLLVGLEVHDVDFVKPYEGHEQPDVCLSELVPSQIPAFAQYTFHPVQSTEQLPAVMQNSERYIYCM